MHKNNIPLKVALGYSAIAIIMILAISLVYSNTKSINAINEASREYIQKGVPPTAPYLLCSKRNRKT